MQRTIEVGAIRHKLSYDDLAAIVTGWEDGVQHDPSADDQYASLSDRDLLRQRTRDYSPLNQYVAYRVQQLQKDHRLPAPQVEYSIGYSGALANAQLLIAVYSGAVILDTILLSRPALTDRGTPRYSSYLLPRTMLSFTAVSELTGEQVVAMSRNPCSPLIACVYRTVAFVEDVPHPYNVDYDFGNELCFLAAKLLHGDEASDLPIPDSIGGLISELDRRYLCDVSYVTPTQTGELVPVLSTSTEPVLVKVTVLHRNTRRIAHEVVCRI